MAEQPEVCVIGAGVGALVAIDLARAGVRVVLVDERPDILSGASGTHLGRLHLGHHYSGDGFTTGRLNTAQRCVRGALAWMRRYPEMAPTTGRWWQLITTDSMTAPADYVAFCEQLAEDHESLATDAFAREALGPPGGSFRVMDPDEYLPHVAPGRVAAGVETQERVVDLDVLREALRGDLAAEPMLEVRCSTRVVAVHRNRGGFMVETAAGGTIHADAVVDCSWHDLAAWGTVDENAMTTRLRLVAVASTPQALRGVPSMFFHRGVLGNHTATGTGTVRFVSEPVCNLRVVPGVGVPERWRALMIDPTDTRRWGPGIAAALRLPRGEATDALTDLEDAFAEVVAAEGFRSVATPVGDAPEVCDVDGALDEDAGERGVLVRRCIEGAIVDGYAELVPAMRACRDVVVLPMVSVDLGDGDLWSPDSDAHRRDLRVWHDGRGLVSVYPGKFTFAPLAATDAVSTVLAHLALHQDVRGRVRPA